MNIKDEIFTFFNEDLDRIPDLLKRLYRQAQRFYNPQFTKMGLGDITLLLYEVNFIILNCVKVMLNFNNDLLSKYFNKDLLINNDNQNSQNNLNLELNNNYWNVNNDNFELLVVLLELNIKILQSHLLNNDTTISHQEDNNEINNVFKINEFIPLIDQPKQMIIPLKYQLMNLLQLILYNNNNNNQQLAKDKNNISKVVNNSFELLIKLKFTKSMIKLAEDYKLYELLAKNLHLIYNENQLNYKEAINYFTNQHGQSFLNAMLNHLSETKEYSKLIKLANNFPNLAYNFLAIKHRNLLFFLNLSQKNWELASHQLISLAESNQKLLPKKVFYSLGKLAIFCEKNNEDVIKKEVIDDQLDIVLVHEQILQLLNEKMTKFNISFLPPLSLQKIEPLFQHLLPKLIRTKRKTMVMLFKEAILDILMGRNIELEMLIDVLTLKINIIDTSEFGFIAYNGFELSFEVLRRMDNSITDDGFKYALRTLWRRVILFDNWDYIDKEEEEYGFEHTCANLYQTALYSMVIIVMDHNPGYLLPPNSCVHEMEGNYLKNRHFKLNDNELELLKMDYESENQLLLNYINEHRLLDYYAQIINMVNKDLGRV
ncbi:hypothetical protein K502DRAFT_105864 [Neoconidiobolus thromboides FSU 785]|nr:hypothetical protein K502DRAFT_105864 [Neoconidiobolus thromboides FSU 785]